MKETMKNVEKHPSGTLELLDEGQIKYFLVTQNQKDFYLTSKEQPGVKNEAKYTNLYYKKNQ